jgi:hypothetical protein
MISLPPWNSLLPSSTPPRLPQISLLDKNIVQIKKGANGQIKRLPVKNESDSIQLAAQLGSFTLDKYDVSKGLSETMDVAAQVAVAAGFEALKNAGLVTGSGAGGWMVDEQYVRAKPRRGRSGSQEGLSGGDPPNPPCGRRGCPCARPHMRSAAHAHTRSVALALGHTRARRTCARSHMGVPN